MARFLGYEPCPKCRINGRDTRGDNLAIYDDGSRHCFAECGYHIGPRHFSPRRPKDERPDAGKNLLPADFTREVPAAAWQWLLQYGLPYSYWKDHCGYSPSEGRLIFTVGEPMAFSIGRLVAPDKAGRKWYAYGYPHTHAEVIDPRSLEIEDIIVVEDIVSAHKVGQVATTVPLFGAKIHKPHLYYLMNAGRPVKIWLDKDQEANSKKMAIGLQSIIGEKVDVITTMLDPKCYQKGEIMGILM